MLEKVKSANFFSEKKKIFCSLVVFFLTTFYSLLSTNFVLAQMRWNIETVDSAGSVGEWTSIALDTNGYPHISYYDGTNEDLKYAKWTGTSWSIQTVDSAGFVGFCNSIALDSNNYPHISYRDSTNYDLKYAKWTGSSWSIETVDSTGNVGYGTSIVSGIISTTTTWTLANSPYIVTGNVFIESGATLIIEPGVVVKFSTGTYLKTAGILKAEGTTSNYIILTSAKTAPSAGDWQEIKFVDSSDDANCIISYCEIKYAQYGIYCDYASPTISNNIISDNNDGIRLMNGSSPKINNNTISNNSRNGIWTDYCSSQITYNIISNNGASGIETPGGGLSISSNTISGNSIGILKRYVWPIGNISNNDIYGNISYNFKNTDSNNIMASNNWWGTTNEEEIQAKIYDFYDNFDYGKVIYTPFATEPFFAPLPTTGSISGTVTKSADGTAISGATVETLQNSVIVSSVTCNVDGTYQLVNLSTGTYDVRASASGYQTQTQTGKVVYVNQTTTVNFLLVSTSPVLSVSPTSLSFGEIVKGKSKTMSFTVTNTGGGTLSVTNITADKTWISVSPTNFSLSTGASTSISVTVSPTRELSDNVTYTGQVSITSNGGNASVSISVIPTCAIAYPEPISLSSGKELTFWGTGVAYGTIRIYTLTGELVRELRETNGNDKITYDLTNENGEKIVRGIYLYTATNPKEPKGNRGKFTVIK